MFRFDFNEIQPVEIKFEFRSEALTRGQRKGQIDRLKVSRLAPPEPGSKNTYAQDNQSKPSFCFYLQQSSPPSWDSGASKNNRRAARDDQRVLIVRRKRAVAHAQGPLIRIEGHSAGALRNDRFDG